MSCVVISYYLVVTPKTTTTTTRKTHTIQILQKEWIQEECREEEVETTELNVKSGGDWQFNDLFRKVVRSHYKNQATAYKQLKKKVVRVYYERFTKLNVRSGNNHKKVQNLKCH